MRFSLGQVHRVPELVRVDHENPGELSARVNEKHASAYAVRHSTAGGDRFVDPRQRLVGLGQGHIACGCRTHMIGRSDTCSRGRTVASEWHDCE